MSFVTGIESKEDIIKLGIPDNLHRIKVALEMLKAILELRGTEVLTWSFPDGEILRFKRVD